MKKSKPSIKFTKRSLKFSTPYSSMKFIDPANLSPKIYCEKIKLNPVPLPSASHRAVISVNSNMLSPASLENKQKQMRTFFRRVNSEQRVMTSRIIRERKEEEEKIVIPSDSFSKRYDPVGLTFSHKLIGNVKLPRTVFNIIPQSKELETIRCPVIKPVEKPITGKSISSIAEQINSNLLSDLSKISI